MTLKKT